MSVTILHSKQFKKGYIFEMKFNQISDSGEKSDRFQWVLIYQNKRYFLDFIKCEDGIRFLAHKDCQVKLDLTNNSLIVNSEIYSLEYTDQK